MSRATLIRTVFEEQEHTGEVIRVRVFQWEGHEEWHLDRAYQFARKAAGRDWDVIDVNLGAVTFTTHERAAAEVIPAKTKSKGQR